MVDIHFPLEFLIAGTPVSLQAKNPRSKEEWKERVKAATYPQLPEMHFASEGRVAVTIFYFPPGEMQGDIDNIVKTTLDGLCAHIYVDDRQVERVVVQKFEPNRVFEFSNPTEKLVEALQSERPVTFVRISDDPHGELS